MAWKIEFSNDARRQLRKLDRQAQRKIVTYLTTKVAPLSDPQSLGKPLRGSFKGFWRYRVESYRVVCSHIQGRLMVLVVRVGNRKDVYAADP